MPAKRFDFTPIPQPAAPARDSALTASPDGSAPFAAARLVPLRKLVADPDQPRKTFDDEAMHNLTESLRTAGLRQPITAYYDDSREQFVVVSGERRLIAATRAGMTHVPVLVEHRPTSDGDKLVLQLAENLVREDLTVPDAARALARLKELRPGDWLDVAARHGIGRRRAYQFLEYLNDPEPLRAALDRGDIADGHAQELRRVAPPRLDAILGEVIESKLSVRDTRQLIAGDSAAKAVRRSRKAAPRELPTAPSDPIDAGTPSRSQVTAGEVADLLPAASGTSTLAPANTGSAGAALRERKQRRERSRRLRERLERIALELRNMHVDDVSSELTALPEIIKQARETRDSLDRFIDVLERVRLDAEAAMEQPPA